MNPYLILSISASLFLAACNADAGLTVFTDYDKDDDAHDSIPMGGDCDDTNAQIYPDAPEICDNKDNNCNEKVDENPQDGISWYVDADGDGQGAASTEALAILCAGQRLNGAASNNEDCDDTNSNLYSRLWYYDTDRDNYGQDDQSTYQCAEKVPLYAVWNGDCNDTNAMVNPSVLEICDSIDNNCNGTINESTATDATTWYIDSDNDGYGSTSLSQEACEQPPFYASNSSDCDDSVFSTNPGALEYCNEVDDNCNGEVDEDSAADAPGWGLDNDGDGYGNALGIVVISCIQPSDKLLANATDCNDADPLINPDAREICNTGIDENCDGGALECTLEGDIEIEKADFTFIGAGENYNAGTSVDGAGDLNGDGQEDILIGSEHYANVGYVYAMLGPVSGAGISLSNSALTLQGEDWASTGAAVSNAGDVDGDGFNDIWMGSNLFTDREVYQGAAHLYLGPVIAGMGTRDLQTEADGWIVGEESYNYLGYDVSAAGDLDNDGMGDLLVGAPYVTKATLASDEGAVYLVHNPLDVTNWSTPSEFNNISRFYGELEAKVGIALAGNIDLNADGNFDFLLGAPDLKTVYGVLGPVSSTPADYNLDAISSFILRGPSNQFGSALSSDGDVDGDGYPDLLVSVPGDYQTMLFYYDSTSFVGELSAATMVGTTFNNTTREDEAPKVVEIISDLNGDGSDECFVSDPNSNDVWYFRGGGLTGTYDTAKDATAYLYDINNDGFGYAIANAGDVIGSEGIPDILIGAPQQGMGSTSKEDYWYNNGAALLLSGGEQM